MATALESTHPETIETLADLLDRLGGVPPARIRFRPAPGLATERDVLEARRDEGRLCELVDGVLVEKAMGLRESLLAMALGALLREFVLARNLGIVSGEGGPVRLFPGLVRLPDVAFIAWDRLPGGGIPEDAIPSLAPDLVVEILSESNTPAEMARKRREFFDAGGRLFWMIDPRKRVVRVFTAPERSVTLEQSATLDGGDVLPGFALALGDLFAELDRRG